MSHNETARRRHALPRTLVLIVGVPGVGKSDFSKEILRRVGLVYVNKDTLTEALSPDTRSDPKYLAIRDQIYDTMYRVVEENLRAGNSVLLDAPHVKQMGDGSWRDWLDGFITDTGARMCIIRLVCSEQTLHARLKARGLPRDAEKLADWATFRSAEPMWFAIPFDHCDTCSEEISADYVESAVQYILGPDQPDEIDHFESLRVLWQGALDSFNQRRVYEWRMVLAVWGAMVGLMIGAVSEKAHVSLPIAIILTGSALAFACILTYWIQHLRIRNNEDRDIAEVYWDAMCALARTGLPEVVSRNIRRRRLTRKDTWWSDWNHRSQILITWLLGAIASLVIIGSAWTSPDKAMDGPIDGPPKSVRSTSNAAHPEENTAEDWTPHG